LTVTDRFLSAGTYTGGNLVLTVTGAPTLTIPIPQSVITNTQTGKRIATHTSGSGVAVDIRETITDIDLTGNVLSYEREDGEITQVTLPSGVVSTLTPTNTGRTIATHNNGAGVIQNIQETITTLQLFGTNTLRYTNEAGTITNILVNNNYVDGVTYSQATQFGTGLLTFTRVGLPSLTVNIPSLTPSAITNTIAGNTIATHTNATGVMTNIRESITTLGLSGNTLSYLNEAGTTVNLTLPVGATSSITGTIAGNPIATHNNGLGVSTVIRETITNLSLAGNTLTYLRENGATNVITLPTGATSSVTGTVAGHAIGTHNNGAGTSTVIRETVTSLTISGSTLTYTDENGTANPVTIPSGGGGGSGSSVYVENGINFNQSYASTIVWNGTGTFGNIMTITGPFTNGMTIEVFRMDDGGGITFSGATIAGGSNPFFIAEETWVKGAFVNGVWYLQTL
jgi:type IV pilus biogenesis protein CpaD/CtpE